MAYDYEKTKQAYQSMSREQQQQFVNQNQNDASFQRFMGDYMNEINGKSTTTQQATQNNANSNISNGTNGQNQQTLETYNQNQQKDSNYNSDGTYKFTATEPLAKPNNNPYDPNETLQTDMFQTPANNQVVVKEGTAQQTGTPDYQLDSDARNKEITDNLNYYRQNNQDYFKDRATYNSIFHYDERSEGQKAILDSYWKKKNLQDSTIKYGTGDSIVQGMNDIDITEDQLNYIKANNEGAYREWQAKQQEMIDKIIANQSVPTVDEIVNKLTDYIDKLDLGSQRYDFMQYNEELKQQYQIDSKLSALEGTIAQMQSDKSKIDSVISKYSNAGADTMGGAAANYARMQRALAPYNESFAKNAQIYSAQLQSYQMSAAQVKSDLNVMYQQTQEDQRIWNNKLKALGFAMDVDSYRTPEQQMNLRLQEQYQKGQISLLQQSQLNDLSLYNQYASAKLQDQIQFERTDLEVEDENQRRTNLNNVLSQYYSEYGDIIQRSQAQALNDILKYAKDHNCSVGEALTENFIKPLQSKAEYKQKITSSYGMGVKQTIGTVGDKTAVLTTNPDGTISWSIISDNPITGTSQSENIKGFKSLWSDSQDWSSYIENVFANVEQGTWGGQCGAGANDILTGAGLQRVFGNSLKSKIDVCDQKYTNMTPSPNSLKRGDFVVLDTGAKLSDGTDAGHVGIIDHVEGDKVYVLDSNGQAGKEKRGISSYSIDIVRGTYDASSRAGSNPNYSGSYDPNKSGIYEKYLNGSLNNALIKTMGGKDKLEAEAMAWASDSDNIALSKEATKEITSLRKEFDSQEEVKQFNKMKQYYNTINASNNGTAMGDLSLIFAYMKLLDPNSTVRESEFESVGNAGALPEKIQNYFNKYVSGERLTSKQRNEIITIAQEQYNTYARAYNETLEKYQGYINEGGNPNGIGTKVSLVGPLEPDYSYLDDSDSVGYSELDDFNNWRKNK